MHEPASALLILVKQLKCPLWENRCVGYVCWTNWAYTEY